MAGKKFTEIELTRRGYLPPTAIAILDSKIARLETQLVKAKAKRNAIYWYMPKEVTGSEHEKLPKAVQEKYELDHNVLEAFGTKLYILRTVIYSNC